MSTEIADSTGLFADTVPVGGTSLPSNLFKNTSYNMKYEDNGSAYLKIEISDAVSHKEDVVFTIKSKTNMSEFKTSEFSVNRIHDDFLWLHDQLTRNDEFAGFIIPPPPPHPNFDPSRSKLQRLSKSDGIISADELQKMKTELEAEYLAAFKKTVAMHEVFIQRIAAHPVMCNDYGFHVFLEFDDHLSVRTKNTKEKAVGFFKYMSKSADENLILANILDEDPFFRDEKNTIFSYYKCVKDAYSASESASRCRRSMNDSILRLEACLKDIITVPPINSKPSELELALRLSQIFGLIYPLEARISADEDLKMTDTLLYYTNEMAAAKDLLYRRYRALANFQSTNKILDKARSKSRDVEAAIEGQNTAHKLFDEISNTARSELEELKLRRVTYFKKHIIGLAELQVKHSKDYVELLRNAISRIKEVKYST